MTSPRRTDADDPPRRQQALGGAEEFVIAVSGWLSSCARAAAIWPAVLSRAA